MNDNAKYSKVFRASWRAPARSATNGGLASWMFSVVIARYLPASSYPSRTKFLSSALAILYGRAVSRNITQRIIIYSPKNIRLLGKGIRRQLCKFMEYFYHKDTKNTKIFLFILTNSYESIIINLLSTEWLIYVRIRFQ